MDSLGRIISDDSVEYRLYFARNTEDEDFALATLSSISSRAKDLSRGYLWHCEDFNLELVRPDTAKGKSTPSIPIHLRGVTHFGDNFDDEWFVVYILLEISKVFEDLVISVEDSDGEFLLIEAANSLPRWLTPENADNRVFLHKGLLHIIPQASHPGQVGIYPAGTPSIQQALQLVYDDSVDTVAAPAVQQCLSTKVSIFPDHIKTSQHRAQCIVPKTAAHIFLTDPSLVAPAVQTFYARDPLQMRSCRTMKHFPPAKPEDCIRMNVTFTKCLYAQLRQQKFQPGVKSGWRVPPPSDERHVACDLGVKLCYGLEILRRQAPKTVAEASSAEMTPADMCVGPRWDNFLACLKKRDYFRQEIEGSKEYRRLLVDAQAYFAKLIAKEEAPSEESLRRSTDWGRRIQNLLDNVPVNEERLLCLSKEALPAESEDWMTVNQSDLDKLLQQYRAHPLASGQARDTESGSASASGTHHPKQSRSQHSESDDGAAEELESLVSNMKKFMSGLAGHEGAEFPDAGPDSVNFSTQGFTSAMSSLLNGGEAEEESSDIELEDDLDLGGLDDLDEDLSDGPASEAMRSYFEEMDRQLAQTDVGQSFAEASATGQKSSSSNDLPPVDIDMNLVKNLLASYGAQEGLAGPAANILQGMGVNMQSLDQSAANFAQD